MNHLWQEMGYKPFAHHCLTLTYGKSTPSSGLSLLSRNEEFYYGITRIFSSLKSLQFNDGGVGSNFKGILVP